MSSWSQEVGTRQAAQTLESIIASEKLYESPAFGVSHEGLTDLLTEVKRVDALITAKPPGHPVSIDCNNCNQTAQMPSSLQRPKGVLPVTLATTAT